MTSLRDALSVNQAPADELVTTFGFFFGTSRWDRGRVVEYLEGDKVALRVLYEKSGFGIQDIERGPGLTETRLAALLGTIEDEVLADHGTVVHRDFLFSAIPVEGWWRFNDDWQIFPAPQQAPRLTIEMGPHPFLVEFRVRTSPNAALMGVRRGRRLWELHVVLSLLLQGGADWIGPRVRHFWGYEFSGQGSEYVQEMYFVPNYSLQVPELSDVNSLPEITEIPEGAYLSRRGISEDHRPLQVPDSLRDVAQRLNDAPEGVRDKFLLSAYWRSRSESTWDESLSLSYISAVNALEVLGPEGEMKPCPECGLNTAPGPTRRIKELLDTYAPEVDLAQRQKLYRLRSSLVHGHALLGLDLPRGFGALVPRSEGERDTFAAALLASRLVALRWLRAST